MVRVRARTEINADFVLTVPLGIPDKAAEYTTERIHSALDYLTPAELEAMALGQPIPFL